MPKKCTLLKFRTKILSKKLGEIGIVGAPGIPGPRVGFLIKNSFFYSKKINRGVKNQIFGNF